MIRLSFDLSDLILASTAPMHANGVTVVSAQVPLTVVGRREWRITAELVAREDEAPDKPRPSDK